MNILVEFSDLVSEINKSENSNKLPDALKLELYANYKQALVGDINIPPPSIFNIVATEKHKAWTRLKGTAKEDAARRYINIIKKENLI